MHDRYWEDAIGREKPIESAWLKEVRWRVSTLNATPPQFPQHYLAPLRFSDVQTITKGGFLIGTLGVEPKIAEFARAFRSLPAVVFADLPDAGAAFGSLFNTTGIPVSEFARHVPFGRRQSIDLLRHILSSCAADNLFLPGSFSETQVQLSNSGELHVHGRLRDDTPDILRDAQKRLARAFRHLGAILIPGSFTMAAPGSDLHPGPEGS